MGEENLRVLADAQGGVLPRTLKFRPPFSSLVSPASLHFFVVFSLFLVVNLCLPGHRSGENSESPSYALHAEAKKVLGLARGGTYEPVADFCFSIPEGQKGRIMAQTVSAVCFSLRKGKMLFQVQLRLEEEWSLRLALLVQVSKVR
nr:putative transmembrane protein [Toxoplasma gondii TgCATBr9]